MIKRGVQLLTLAIWLQCNYTCHLPDAPGFPGGFTDVLALKERKDKNRLSGSHLGSDFNATRGRPPAFALCSDCCGIKMLDNVNR